MNPELMQIDTTYTRVMPRDLFNEAKLLKCLALLCLRIHDGLTPVLMSVNDELGESAQGLKEDGYPQEGFSIGLMDDGYLAVANLDIFIMGTRYAFRTQYNSKANYPLYVTAGYVDYLVFDERGEWDQEFIDFCQSL